MVKQIIIINPNTGYSKGRMMAQCAHASIMSILNLGVYKGNSFYIDNIDPDMLYWMKESFTKIVYKASSFLELKTIIEEAKLNNIPTFSMIEDDTILTAVALKPSEESNLLFLDSYNLRLA
jgi:peptidyl-tRNA hydrolase